MPSAFLADEHNSDHPRCHLGASSTHNGPIINPSIVNSPPAHTYLKVMSANRGEPGTFGAPPNAHLTTPEDVRVILLFGCTGTGKTSFANIASGSNMEVGKGLRSSTKYLESSRVFQVDGRPVMIIDCPGFNDTYLTETEILRRLAEYLKTEASQRGHKIVGLIYFHKISDTRVGGTSLRHMCMFKALCGTRALRHATYVTNMWSNPPTEDEILREEELYSTDEFFGAPIANGARIARHYNTQESAHQIIRALLDNDRVITELQYQLMEDKKPLEETDVGRIIGQDLEDDLIKRRQEMSELMVEKENALKANDQNWLRQLEAQEGRTNIKERQLVSQLRSLRASQAKQLLPTSQQTCSAQTEPTNPGLSAVLARLEAEANESRQNGKLQAGRSNAHTSSQREWNKQRDEQTARDLAEIHAMTDLSRRQASRPRKIKAFMASTGTTVLNLGIEFASFFSGNDIHHQAPNMPRERGNRMAIGGSGENQIRFPNYEPGHNHLTTTHGYDTREQTALGEYVVPAFGPLLPNHGPGTADVQSRQRQASSGFPPHRLGGSEHIHTNERDPHPAPPREPGPTYHPAMDPYQQFPLLWL